MGLNIDKCMVKLEKARGLDNNRNEKILESLDMINNLLTKPSLGRDEINELRNQVNKDKEELMKRYEGFI